MSQFAVESMPNPFQQRLSSPASGPLDIVLLAFRENISYDMVTGAVHSLAIKRYNEARELSDSGAFNPGTLAPLLQRDLYDILLGGFHAVRVGAKTAHQYTFLVMCVLMASTWKHRSLQRMPAPAWKSVRSLLSVIKNCLVDLISPPKGVRSDSSPPRLTKATTQRLDFSIVVLHFSALDRALRNVLFKVWPHAPLLPTLKSLELIKNTFSVQGVRCQWLLLSALTKSLSEGTIGATATVLPMLESKLYEQYWRSVFKKALYNGALYVYDGIPMMAKRVQNIATMMLIESAIYRTSATHFSDVVDLVGLNFENEILKEGDPRKDLSGWGQSSNIRKPISNNGKTLLKTASKWVRAWGNDMLFGAPLKKCEELVVLFEMLKHRRWHAASEYCESSSEQDCGERAHLASVLEIAKRDYTVKQLQAKHGVGVPDDLVPLLKDATLADVEAWKKNAANFSLAPTLKEENIVWVDTVALAEEMVNELKGANVVGIDLEWRDPAPVSLLQIATITKAYLIDASRASMEDHRALHSVLATTLEELLVSTEIVKCAFGAKVDFRRLAVAFPSLTYVVGDTGPTRKPGLMQSLVDFSLPPDGTPGPIQVLIPEKCEEYRKQYKEYTGMEEGREAQAGAGAGESEVSARRCGRRKRTKKKAPVWHLSLTRLCKEVFGLGLDKTEQCSNWERRPLNHRQVVYAANDAHVLVRLYAKYLEAL